MLSEVPVPGPEICPPVAKPGTAAASGVAVAALALLGLLTLGDLVDQGSAGISHRYAALDQAFDIVIAQADLARHLADGQAALALVLDRLLLLGLALLLGRALLFFGHHKVHLAPSALRAFTINRASSSFSGRAPDS